MPLARLDLRNEYGLGVPELYRNSSSGKEGAEAILHGVAVSGLVGILRQLGDVAEFGAEIFHDLHEQVMMTSARGQKMLTKIKKLEEALPSIEDAICRKESYIDLAYETGSCWHADLKIIDSHLSCDDLPQFIADSYEECRDPPRLYLLDKYDHAGTGACLKRYSDPSYFKRACATSEPEKAQQIQKEKKLQKIKRKYSRLREGEVQDPISTSQCNSLESSARFAPLSNDDQSYSAENSSVSEVRLKSEVKSVPRLSNTMSKLNCNGQISEINHSVIPDAPEYDKFSVYNIQNINDHTGASQLHNDELAFDVDDDSQYDFLQWKGTSRSPSVIWDEKSEVVKATGLKSYDNTQDSKVEEPSRTGSLNQEKSLPFTVESTKSSCDLNQLEEINETDNYVDALNTLEMEAETDSECQTKCTQSLSNMGHQKNESGVESIDGSHLFENSVLTMSTPQIQISPPISVSKIPSTKLWTNGNLLGLAPSKPVDVSLPNGTGERTQSISVISEKQNKATQYELVNDDYNLSEEKSPVYNQRKMLNSFGSPTFINKTDYGLLKKSNSFGSHNSQNSSPPLEHMKISFHPMNSLEASNLKIELPEGCINERIDGNVSPSFCLFSGCTFPAEDGASESDDDTFCKSYPYSTEDLLSARSDSNSELWEQEDCSGSKINELSDDLRRISSSTASISSYSGFEQMNRLDRDITLKDICAGNDMESFQSSYTTNIPTFESLINQDVIYDSLSISPENTTTLTPTELPPPPPLPPIQWRLVRPTYEISEDDHSNISQMVNHFEEPLKESPPAPTEMENIIRWPLPLAEDGQYKKMQENQKLNGLLQTHKPDRREQSLHQIRDKEIQHKLKPCEETKSQIASSDGVDEKDLLHQIRAKTLNLKRTTTSRPISVTQPTTNDRVAAILEKANAIRQACASSDEDNDEDWSND